MRQGLTYTLVFIKNDFKILLGLKKRGLGKDKWNGFGGKVEKNETICNGAIRETKEESNLTITNPKQIAVLTYENRSSQKIAIVHIFTTDVYSDALQESEEMLPKWFPISDIPYSQMWQDTIFWFPFMLQDKFFHAHSIYSDENTFNNCCIEEYNSLDQVVQNVQQIIDKKCI